MGPVSEWRDRGVVARDVCARTGAGYCGGGVFVNVRANKLIMALPEVEYLGVLPSCGDESLSHGAAALDLGSFLVSKQL